MGDPLAAPEPARPPEGRRWKLWHLTALVAGSAVFLAVGVRVPSLLFGVSIAAALGAPLVLAVLVRDRWLGGWLRWCGVPPESSRDFLIKAVLFVALLFAFPRWMSFVSAVFKRIWTD